jgi:methionine biosynthesis protein MetW
MTVEHINKQIYDKQFENDERELMYNLLIQGKLKKMKSLITGFEGRVLDVGCGNCWTNQLFEGARVEHFGIDISDNALERAQKKGVTVKKVDLDADPIPFEDNFFDLVLCSDIIEHTLYPENIVKEARRVLKEGGSLIVVVPNIASWFNRILLLFGYYPWGVESTGSLELNDVFFHWNTGHMHTYTKKSIISLLDLMGFKPQQCLGAHLNVSSVMEQCVNLRADLMADKKCPLFLLKLFNSIGNFYALFPSLATEIIVKAQKSLKP